MSTFIGSLFETSDSSSVTSLIFVLASSVSTETATLTGFKFLLISFSFSIPALSSISNPTDICCPVKVSLIFFFSFSTTLCSSSIFTLTEISSLSFCSTVVSKTVKSGIKPTLSCTFLSLITYHHP